MDIEFTSEEVKLLAIALLGARNDASRFGARYGQFDALYAKIEARISGARIDITLSPNERILALYPDAKIRPDHNIWINRIEHGISAGKPYMTSQNSSTGEWACSCRAYISRRSCEHINKLKKGGLI